MYLSTIKPGLVTNLGWFAEGTLDFVGGPLAPPRCEAQDSCSVGVQDSVHTIYDYIPNNVML